VADIFHEVDEEVRREKLKQLWERYSLLIIAVCVLIVAGIGAWRGYDWYVAREAAKAGARFEAAAALMEQGKTKEAESAFADIASSAPGGYPILARLREANALAASDKAAAVRAFDSVAQDSRVPAILQDLAAVRAGLLLVDSSPLTEMQRRLDPLAQSDRAFRHSARELLALSAWHNNDVTAAKKYLDEIAKDAETPAGVRARTEMIAALIQGTGKG
jgi:hypothetical protein